MDINQLVHSDAALDVIDNGTWVDESVHNFPGLRIKVRGLQSEAVVQCIAKKQVAVRALNKGEKPSPEQAKQIHKEALAEEALLDWDGLTNNGEPVPYSKEQAIAWLTKRNGDKLANVVHFCAMKVDEDAESFVKAAEKN